MEYVHPATLHSHMFLWRDERALFMYHSLKLHFDKRVKLRRRLTFSDCCLVRVSLAHGPLLVGTLEKEHFVVIVITLTP